MWLDLSNIIEMPGAEKEFECLLNVEALEFPSVESFSSTPFAKGKVVNTAAAQFAGTARLTLSEQTRPMRGGFVMVDEDVEVNCTFETLVRMQREKLEREVANVLFK